MRTLVKYRPNGLRAFGLFDEMDKIFDGFFREDSGVHFPKVDVREDENSYLLEAELPGLTEKDVDVKVEENLLHISTNRDEKKQEKTNSYLMRERRSSQYHRTFVLPKDVDKEKIEAKFKDGLLTLKISKSESVKPREIEVKKA